MSIIDIIASIADNFKIFDSYAFFRRYLTKSYVAILVNHRVCQKIDEWALKSLFINSRNFEKQIQYLCENFRILSLFELVQSIKSGKTLPEKSVVITFDDGYKDVYLSAYPILRKYNIPATIFLVTGHITSQNPFWWDKIAYALDHTSINYINFDLGKYPHTSQVDKVYAKSTIIKRLKMLPEYQKNLLINKILYKCETKIPSDLGKRLMLSYRRKDKKTKKETD